MAAMEADRVASAAEQNFKEVLLSLRNSLDVVYKTQRMLELDSKCNCLNPYSNDGESKWERRKRRRELEKTAYSIAAVLRKCLTKIETKLPDPYDEIFDVLPKPKRPAVVGDVIMYWCDRVCVYEKAMDSTVWCTTPQAIMELVFARLPLGQIFQMRGLSKHWRGLIMSQFFQHAFGTTTSSRFAFMSGSDRRFILDRRRIRSYGIREQKWYTREFEFPTMSGDFVPVAADGGLLCCLCPAIPTEGIHNLEVYVCNPLTQAWRKLPLPSQVHRFDLVHMVTDTETKQYTITAVSHAQQYNHHQSTSSKMVMEVYNSATNTWNASSKGAFQSDGNNLVYYKKYVHGFAVGIRVYDQTTGYSMSIPSDLLDDYDSLNEIAPFEVMGTSPAEVVDISSAERACNFPVTVYQGLLYMLRTEEEEVKANGVWVLRPPNHVWEKLYSVPNPDELEFHLFSLIVCADVIAIFGDGDCDEEQPRKPYYWMLDKAQDTWIDMADQNVDHIIWSQIVLELRLDAIP